MSISFSPTSAGAKSASLNLSTNAATSPTLTLSGTGANPTYKVNNGVAQKGPLILGSTVTAQELDADLSPTGKQYSYQITSDLGTFSPTSTFGSQYIGLNASGYYFDEVANALSTGTVTLNGYSDLTAASVLNVNLLTTLAYRRIQHLVTSSNMTFGAASTQAENEVLAALGIPSRNDYGSFGSLDLSGGTDGDHILAAISSLFVYGNSAGPLSQLIANFQSDIGANGIIADPTTTAALANAAKSLNLARVAANLTGKYSSVGVAFAETSISDWIASSGDGVIGKFAFQVPFATASSVFTFPTSVVDQFAATPVSVTAGQLTVNGTQVSGPVSLRAGDVVRLSPASDYLPNGKLTAYLVSGSTNLAKVTFIGGSVWTLTGYLITERLRNSATLLRNGMVLVAGGAPLDGIPRQTTGAEIYNPSTGTWTVAGSMGTARYNHTATLMADGRVLVVGGSTTVETAGGGCCTQASLVDAEIYDPATGTWTATASMTTTRDAPTATLLPNGTVLFAGGAHDGQWQKTADIYNPAAGSWTTTGSMATARIGHTATPLSNGTVLVAGGSSSSGVAKSTEIYDPATGTWTATGNMTSARFAHTATLLPNGTVLVAGGQSDDQGTIATSTEIYDPATGTWTATGNLTTARRDHTATLLPNGTVLVAGGYTPNDYSSETAEIYDPDTGKWTATGSMTTGRAAHNATMLANGTVLVDGGSTVTARTEIYHP